MRILLDTNAFIWASTEPDKLTAAAKSAILDRSNERFVSLASLWEMQVKQSLGKLPLPGSIDLIGRAWCQALGASLLGIDLRHIAGLSSLRSVHKDPFDRMIVAQAVAEEMAIVSADEVFQAYPPKLIW